MRRTRTFVMLMVLALLSGGLPASQAQASVYDTPGQHTVNGRQWRTWCEKYSSTARCRTEIWATSVTYAGGRYVTTQGWVMNNLTYLSAPRAMWKGNPLATAGEHVSNGRRWRVECDTAAVGNGCRASIWANVTEYSQGRYRNTWKWVFNNLVQFGPLRGDIGHLVRWRPAAGTKLPTIPDASYNVRKGPNTTNKVTLTFDDCPKSLSSFRATVSAARRLGIGLVLFPTGDCVRSGRFDAAYARAAGHYVFNHSVSHPDLSRLSRSGVVRQLGAPGIVTSYGRPPYGAWNSATKSAYASVGMRIWTWTVDTNDWRGKSTSSLIRYVVGTARGGDAVLMHMQWNGFNEGALRAMKNGLAAKGIQVCRNYPGTTPVRPAALSC